MALDDEAQRIAEEVLGINVLKQLGMAVPEFWDGSYVIIQTTPKPKDQQVKGFPYAVALDLKVIASTAEGYVPGQIVGWEDEIAEIVGKGHSVTVSPEKIRTCRTDEYTLNHGPFDSLVIAEGKDEFWNITMNTIYSYGDLLSGGCQIGYALNKNSFNEGICRCNIQFAFIPTGEKPRPIVRIDEQGFSKGLIVCD